MTFFQLLWRNLLFHWRGNGPVLLGVMVGAAVLTGALLVGDSLQGSLREQSRRRLGWVEQALVAPRFFRQSVAGKVEVDSKARVSPALLLQATVAAGQGVDRRQLRGVNVLAVDDSFFAPEQPPEGFGTPPLAWPNSTLASALGVGKGATVTLRLQKPGDLPRETALARKDVAFEDWDLTVARPLEGDEPGNLFNLRPELETPRTLLVPLQQLQDRLGRPGEVNAMLAAGNPAALHQALRRHLDLEDWGLELFTPARRADALMARYDRNRDGVLTGREWFTRQGKTRKPRFAAVIAEAMKPAEADRLTRAEVRAYYEKHHPYLALESKQMLISEPVRQSAQAAARAVDLRSAGTLVYLCRLDAAGQRIAGVVAALDPTQPPPLGPFLPPGPTGGLQKSEIVLVDRGQTPGTSPGARWHPEKKPTIGDEVVLTFKPPESHGPAPDIKTTFRLAGYIPLQGVAADPALTPEFPGITDKEDAGDWALPFDDPAWQQQTIRKEYTDAYWDAYRATPKAYINLKAGQALWGSRFGRLTSIRLALTENHTSAGLEAAARRFRAALREGLKPEEGGFLFDDVKQTAEIASKGGTPFGLLFLGFSFFLIASALLLVGLLFRLNLDRRARQVGVFFAEGYPRRTVGSLLLGEGGLLALIGVVLGCVAALAYSRLLVQLLTALWPGGVLESFLRPHFTLLSLAIGAAGALAVSVLTIAWVVRALSRVPPRALLAGQTTGEGELGARRPAHWLLWSGPAAAALGLALLLVGPWVHGHMAQAGTFFGSGSLFLAAGLLGVFAWMRRARTESMAGSSVEGSGWWAIARLGVRNAARHPARSLLTVGLLASAAFLLVAIESFRRRASDGDGSPHAADGGFPLVAESDLPLFRDLNSPEGRREALDKLRFRLVSEQGMAPADADREMARAEALLKETTVIGLRARAGDDASCLNLYKPRTPRVLGVPAALIERGGFQFGATLAGDAEERANPWRILQRPGAPQAFGEANTIEWMLQTGLGKTFEVPDETGQKRSLLIAGLLHDSVFQSSLLVSEEDFLELYPRHEGYNYFLIAPPRDKADDVKRLLERALADRGFEVTPTAQKLAAYLAVENTYLTTFQALGGLGLILGSLGLAVVLLRAVWERRAELALLRALGYRRASLAWLVLAENSFLLLVGLTVGAVSALLSITPQLISGAGAVPWQNLAVLFAGVLVVALSAGALAVAGTLRAPIVPALRRE